MLKTKLDRARSWLGEHLLPPTLIMAALTVGFGTPDSPLRLAQIVLAAAQAVMIVLIAIELLPAAAAIIAGLITAFSPHLAYITP